MYEDFNEIDDILEIEEAEIINIINPEYRQYIVRERPDHLNIWNDSEFFNRFRLSKETVLAILELIEEEIRHKTNR